MFAFEIWLQYSLRWNDSICETNFSLVSQCFTKLAWWIHSRYLLLMQACIGRISHSEMESYSIIEYLKLTWRKWSHGSIRNSKFWITSRSLGVCIGSSIWARCYNISSLASGEHEHLNGPQRKKRHSWQWDSNNNHSNSRARYRKTNHQIRWGNLDNQSCRLRWKIWWDLQSYFESVEWAKAQNCNLWHSIPLRQA